LVQCARKLQQPVCQRAFTMVDVSDNAKIADVFHTPSVFL
jgi:hypothetical protein